MLRVSQIKIPVNSDINKQLDVKIKELLRIDSYDSYRIIKKSIDARNKPDLFYVFTVDVCLEHEDRVLKRCRRKNVAFSSEIPYRWPDSKHKLTDRPVVVGLGPAGLFCAYMLAMAGALPICIERGKPVEQRTKDVEEFWKTGVLNTESNVQFGEGGAGTFSDGKLNTLVNDKSGRNKKVLQIFVDNGAPEAILYDNKPHIGTDILSNVVINMRKKILELGGNIYYDAKLTDIYMSNDKLPKIVGIEVEGIGRIDCEKVVLAIGHSARDTFEMLHDKGVHMIPKAFAVGVRVQHKAKLINYSQYGTDVYDDFLPAASYKLTYQAENGRGVYSFCMCPGGYVVNASSESGMLAINGMSYSTRDSIASNSAIVCTVTPDDYKGDSPLAGVDYQRNLERKAYEIGDGKIPTISYGSFKNKKISNDINNRIDDRSCFKGEYSYESPVYEIFSDDINNSIIEGMEAFGKKIHGFNDNDCIISGVESRTSSPVRIVRDESHNSLSVRGLYPCGEGAGYAGGITSAAMDGILIAEEIWKNDRA